MLAKPLKNLLEELDSLQEEIRAFFRNTDLSNLVDKEFALAKLWREEIESDKKSIYVLGKTSTGKSTFLNFLLDFDAKKTPLFKTSTDTQTGVIQTLEHCANLTDAYAELIVKDNEEIKKLPLNFLQFGSDRKSILIELDSEEKIIFFRDEIIAKSKEEKSFDVMKAINRINIKFPLKYLQNYKIIDTPGLDSAVSETDSAVKENFYGKSSILWFMDGSKRTLSDDLVLINKNEQLFSDSAGRINFIINQFDDADYDGDKTSQAIAERMQEMQKKVKDVLGQLPKQQIKPKIYFTSFLYPKKSFSGKSTNEIITEIQLDQLSIEKDSYYRNIHNLLTTISKIVQLKETLITGKYEELEKGITKLEFAQKKLDSKSKTDNDIVLSTQKLIAIAVKELLEYPNDFDTIKNRKKFSERLISINVTIKKKLNEIQDSNLRLEIEDLPNYYKALQNVEIKNEFSFRGKEKFFIKHIYDGELKEKKTELKLYISNIVDNFKKIMSPLHEDVTRYSQQQFAHVNAQMIAQVAEREKYTLTLKNLGNFRKKIANLDKVLLEEVEQKISEWKPQTSEKTLESFVHLYALTQEHSNIQKFLKL